jgi:hypothetical protein
MHRERASGTRVSAVVTNRRTPVTLAVGVTESDEAEGSAPAMHRAFRLLARMMVRSHRAESGGEANPANARATSRLTAAVVPRTDHTDEAA